MGILPIPRSQKRLKSKRVQWGGLIKYTLDLERLKYPCCISTI